MHGVSESPQKLRIAIIGAGMLGLTSALRLRQAGHDVTLVERDSLPGGLAAGFVPISGGDPVERFYHHIFRTDSAIIKIIAEMGLADQLVWKRPITTCLYRGKLQQLDSPMSLLQFAPLPFVDRLRLGVALALLKATPTVAPFENLRATAWIRRVAGERAYNIIFEPLFRAKFESHADEVSLGWFWARIRDRTPDLGYLNGGFDRLYRSMARRLEDLGVCVRLQTSVTSVERQQSGSLRVRTSGGGEFTDDFDRVLATVPLRLVSKFAPSLPNAFVERYSPVASLWANCFILALNQRVSDAYWINICEQGTREMPFMVFVEHTNFVSPSHYQGSHLIYIGKYSEAPPPTLDSELINELAPHLRVLNPNFQPDWVTNVWQFKAPFAQPIITTDYRKRIAPLATPVPGLFVANIEQVYPHDRGQNYAIELADRVAAEICADPETEAQYND